MAGLIPIAEELVEEGEPVLQGAVEEVVAGAEAMAPKIEAAAESATEAVESAGSKAIEAVESGLGKLQNAFQSLTTKVPNGISDCPPEAAEAAAPEAEAAAAEAGNVQRLDPNSIRFSQNTAGGGGRAATLRDSMSENGWSGPSVDAVKTPDGVVTIDNTRVAVARELGMSEVPVNVHAADELLPESMAGRFGDAKTWGEALIQRTANQRPPLPSTGTLDAPRLPK